MNEVCRDDTRDSEIPNVELRVGVCRSGCGCDLGLCLMLWRCGRADDERLEWRRRSDSCRPIVAEVIDVL